MNKLLFKSKKLNIIKLLHLIKDYLYLRNNPLFNREYYLNQNRDVRLSKMNPLYHFIRYGFMENRNPHPLFDINFYLMKNPDVRQENINPLTHYLRHGCREGRRTHPLFDYNYYMTQKPNLINSKKDLLSDYLDSWHDYNLNPHPLFNTKYFITCNSSIKTSDRSPLENFLMNWEIIGPAIHPLFYKLYSVDYDVEIKDDNIINDDFKDNDLDRKVGNNQALIKEIYDSIKNGNFGYADMLYQMKINESSIVYNNVEKKDSKIYNILSMRDKIERDGKLLYSQEQSKWDMHSDSLHETINIELPREFIGEIYNVSIVGGTRLVFDDLMNLYHDEMFDYDHSEEGDYDIKIWGNITPLKGRKIEIYNLRRVHTKIIKEGILISSDHDNNYFHWLVECLPKVVMLKEFSELRDIPILVGSNLHPNLLKAIEAVTDGRFTIKPLNDRDVYHVERLIYVSDLSRMMDKYRVDYKNGIDQALSLKWVAKTREQLLYKYDNSNSGGLRRRKLYLTRKGGTYRKLLNEDEIELELIDRGFEIVELSKFSFEFQQRLFHQAEIVIAPTGATVTNMLLSPEDTNFIVLTSDHENANLSFWEQLAVICKINIKVCKGKRAFNTKDFHDDFSVDVNHIIEILDDLKNSKK